MLTKDDGGNLNQHETLNVLGREETGARRGTSAKVNDADDEQVLITPPTGAPTRQTYDPVGNLAISNAGGALCSAVVAASCSLNHANPGMIWDTENRLVNIANPDGSSEQNTYSADGLRKSKTTGGPTNSAVVAASCSLNHANPGMIWDNQNLLLETNTRNVVLARYTDFPGKTGYLWLRLASSLASLGGQTEVVLGLGRSRQMRYIWGGHASWATIPSSQSSRSARGWSSRVAQQLRRGGGIKR